MLVILWNVHIRGTLASQLDRVGPKDEWFGTRSGIAEKVLAQSALNLGLKGFLHLLPGRLR